MTMLPVENARTEELFYQTPRLIYQNDANWICPLENDIRDVFSPVKNKFFKTGKIIRWVLLNEEQTPIGRIAAFINKKYKNPGDEGIAGCIGFFECINNKEAADLLFDNARHWLSKEGAVTMDGPINFGERDKWWGLLTEGFQEPLYGMNYHLPYYKDLFEQYGFKDFYHQICFGMDVKKPLQQRIWDRHALHAADPAFSARHLDKKQLDKFAGDFSEVYNKAWAGHGGLKQLTKEQVIVIFKKMKPVMDERIVWYAYYNSTPIGIFINLPDLNQWFKHLNGKFGLLQKIKFLWLKSFQKNKKFTGLAFGIIPEFQGKGVDAYLIAEAAKLLQSDRMPYEQYEMQWIGDFNPKMLNIASNLGEVFITRKLTTYRYIFDPSVPFKRHPSL